MIRKWPLERLEKLGDRVFALESRSHGAAGDVGRLELRIHNLERAHIVDPDAEIPMSDAICGRLKLVDHRAQFKHIAEEIEQARTTAYGKADDEQITDLDKRVSALADAVKLLAEASGARIANGVHLVQVDKKK